MVDETGEQDKYNSTTTCRDSLHFAQVDPGEMRKSKCRDGLVGLSLR